MTSPEWKCPHECVQVRGRLVRVRGQSVMRHVPELYCLNCGTVVEAEVVDTGPPKNETPPGKGGASGETTVSGNDPAPAAEERKHFRVILGGVAK